MVSTNFTMREAGIKDLSHAETICNWYYLSSQERGTGIATRTISYIQAKMEKAEAIIAYDDFEPIGFCYIETFEEKNYVSNSGLIVHKDYRGQGIAKQIKALVFELAKKKYPGAKIFGITTSDKVMKINIGLGYIPTSFTNLTSDEKFWDGCSSCPNYSILLEKNKKMCLCTGMIALPEISKSKTNDNK